MTLLWLMLASATACPNALGQKPFDPTRNPEQDLIAARARAAEEHKNIWLDFGGNWCKPCLELDAALTQDPELAATLSRNYVVVHVAVATFFASKEEKQVRAQVPRFNGYPHIVILAPDGNGRAQSAKARFSNERQRQRVGPQGLDGLPGEMVSASEIDSRLACAPGRIATCS